MGAHQINSDESQIIEDAPGGFMHAYERARAAWPSFEIPLEHFLAYLRERARNPEELDEPCLKDLYLTCGCACGNEAAIKSLEKQYMGRLRQRLARDGRSPALVDEICQQVLVDLLVAKPGKLPRIATYRGLGTLFSWIVVSARRVALKLSPEMPSDPESELSAIERTMHGMDDPEIASIKNRHRDDLRQAIRDAVSSLDPGDMGLLMLNAVNGVSTCRLGHLRGVNQSTISRWLAIIRRAIRVETERLLVKRLGLSPQEYKSMIRLLESDLDLNISQILKGPKGDGGEPV